jgi:hypothetical protein
VTRLLRGRDNMRRIGAGRVPVIVRGAAGLGADRWLTELPGSEGKAMRPARECAVELSAPDGIRTHDLRLRRPTLYPAELLAPVNCRLAICGSRIDGPERSHASNPQSAIGQSGRVDLNHRPPGPEPGALTGLRYAPKTSHTPPNAPRRSRTPNLLIRSQTLYPVELWARGQVGGTRFELVASTMST